MAKCTMFDTNIQLFTQEMITIDHLSDELLIKAYYEAIELSLSKNFINLLEDEMKRRNLSKQVKLLNNRKINNITKEYK
ncbi:MAG TPA: sporulation histidine kinase inhibitor Sda [Pseudogracilibacillus sp.]|nr:sporulation histidine kinase inhibitor Sda [Pseudogracilibacillus sp.]